MTAGINVSYIQPKIVDKKKDLKYAWQDFSITFEPGLLVLFPSYLHHSVPLNKTDKPRQSLAFNVVPEIGFGDERNLTELIF
jgi:ectoine hydroxylase-related dioxygenase (phytanoyl-CoA dioxygenase family)